MADDSIRLSDYKKALRKSVNNGIVDLDATYLHKFNFQIHRYEDVLRNSRMASPPHRWSYHRIGLIKQGEGEVVSGIYKFKAIKNTLVVIPSRVITSSKDWMPETEGYILLFNNDFLLQNSFTHAYIDKRKILSSSIRPYVHLNEEQADEFGKIFETLLTEKKSMDNGAGDLIAIKILELLILSERLIEEELALNMIPLSNNVLKRFVDLLDIYFKEQHSVSFYADQLGLHPNHLNSIIKKHTGLSAKESIRNKILMETKYLLNSTRLSVKEISNEVGFKDQNYFATFFRRSENLSPVKYRATLV